MIIKTAAKPHEGMTLKPLSMTEEIARIDKIRADCIQARIEKFGETPEQAAKAYDDIIRTAAIIALPHVMKRAIAILKALK